jgi:Flp pilus assembly protein TadG
LSRATKRDSGYERDGQRGQALVLFALLLVVIVSGAGLLVDGGMAWANRRAAQSAADLSALAAAKAIADAGFPCNATGLAAAQSAATSVAGFNGFTNVSVEYPATGGSHTGCNYVRVTVSRSMATTFSRVVGQNTWSPQASATASAMRTQGAAAANCTFCSLNSTSANHTLLVQLGSTLIVDGDIYVNSGNGRNANDATSAVKLKDWYVNGDAFDIFGTGGHITAQHISVVGGWETHDGGLAQASSANCPANQHPDPLAYAGLGITSNVCILQAALADPLGSYPTPNYSDYTVQRTSQLHYGGSTVATIQPGIYVGGLKFDGNSVITMAPGVYYLAGGSGFLVQQNATLIASGVMIYSGPQSGHTGNAGPVTIDTTGSVTLSPPTTGSFAGMTIFVERLSNDDITIKPNNTAQCATTAATGLPQGCLGGISGTIYGANKDTTAIIKAAGTANLQVLTGKLLVQNGSTARFTFNSAGFAGGSTLIQLAE